MAKTKQQKEQILKDLLSKLANMKATVFVSFDNFSVKAAEELRQQCQEAGVDYFVVKKNLLNLALQQGGFKEITLPDSAGSVAVAFSNQDEIAPARVLGKFAKSNEQLKLTGGIFESKFIDFARVTELSNLPSKEELLGRLVGSLQSPLAGIVGVLQGNLRKFVYVLGAIKDNK